MSRRIVFNPDSHQTASRPPRRHTSRPWTGTVRLRYALVGWALLPFFGCRLVGERPSNLRDWSPDQAVLPYAETGGDVVHVHNVRDCTYVSEEAYVLSYYDKAYDLNTLRSVDFIMVPFRNMPSIAHTMLSFGFDDGDYLAVSVEIRREKGEEYQFLSGILDQYELIYVLGSERDLVKLRTNYRGDEVYVYRARATPEQARKLFLDVIQRVNKLAAEPEFYNTLTNNCTTNIARHINDLAPGKIPRDFRVLLPGYSDKLAYDLGLLDTSLPFPEARRRANVSELARRHPDSRDFSAVIRR